jgi:hypothetical protein
MLIKVLAKDCGQIIHSKGVFKVVKGFADIPAEVHKELLEFPTLYAQVLEPTAQDIIDELNKTDSKTDLTKPNEPAATK